jgi:hypothetical protein
VKIRYHKVALSSSVAKTGYLYSTLGSNVQHAHDLNLSLLFFLLALTTFGGALWPARRRSSPTPPSPSTRPAVELAGGFPQNHQPPPCPATNTSSLVARLSNPPLQLSSSTQRSSTSLTLPSIELYFFVAMQGGSDRSIGCHGSVGSGAGVAAKSMSSGSPWWPTHPHRGVRHRACQRRVVFRVSVVTGGAAWWSAERILTALV